VNDNKLDDVYDGSYDDRKPVRLTVTMTVERAEGLRMMEDPKHIEARNAQLPVNEKGEVVGAAIVEPANVSFLPSLTGLPVTDHADRASSSTPTGSAAWVGKLSARSKPADHTCINYHPMRNPPKLISLQKSRMGRLYARSYSSTRSS
jgi:hypothetical protein